MDLDFPMDECIELPTMDNSQGLWNYIISGPVKFLPLQIIQLEMVVIFGITQASHYVLKRFGIPRFTTQLLAGMILGPSLLGRFRIFNRILFSTNSQEIIGMVSVWSYIIFMFVSAVKMDIGMINRSGRKALFTGVVCVLSPFLISFPIQVKLGQYYKLNEDETHALPHITIVHCLTPFPVLACLLEDLKILNSELGRLSLAAATVSDMLSTFLTLFSDLTRTMEGVMNGHMVAAKHLGEVIIYLIVIVFAIRPAILWVIRQTPKGRPVNDTYIHTIMLMVLGSGLLSHHLFGVSFFLGPFLLGLAVPDGPPLGSAIVNKFNCFISDVFLPIFITTCGMRSDLSLIEFNNAFMNINGFIIVLTFVTKMAACLVPPFCSKMPINDALALALLLSYKGVVQLSACTRLEDEKLMTDQVYALSSVSILLTTIFMPVLVKYLYHPSRKYAGYQKRNIMHCRSNEELRVLACIHMPDDIAAITKLLEVSCPSSERPLAIYVLHLIELIGRDSPIFISHQMQKKIVSNHSSYSENIILAFNHFKQHNPGVVLVNIFTTISLPKFMHEDICMLGLDKLTYLIILPFHRKWSIDSLVDSEDSTIRTLNCSMLEQAPCSVGILVDRGHLGRSMVSSNSSYYVAMIFLGGKDDREALSFAKRMANDSNITLTVVHFVASGSDVDSCWDKFLDNEILKDVKLNNVGDEYVIYLEEVVKDGPQTALIVRSLVDEFDLIIVGRRHNVDSPQTSGLAEWIEFPELGIMGDLIASSNINKKTSVLVVQQQRIDS